VPSSVPGGVVVTHRNVVAATILGTHLVHDTDTMINYLPLAHIFELVTEFICIIKGATMCYADPKTLTSTGSYPLGALEQYRPTLMVAVPKIWDVIKKGIQAKVAKGSKLQQFLVNTAFEARMRARKMGFDTPLFKALIFKKFSQVVGGRLRFALSGGGPLNADVQSYISTCFGVQVGQGYGLTETCAGLTVTAVGDERLGIAGAPCCCLEVRLDSCPEINDKDGLPYLASDRRDVRGDKVLGRGEVCVRGHNVAVGYYMIPEKTKEEFGEDAWFRTGDIGQFAVDGSLQIIDRKQNLIKLKSGEYIAVENMEMAYGNCRFCDAAMGGICCYGDGDMDRPIALMQLNKALVMDWAKDNGVEGDFNAVKNSAQFYDVIMNDMERDHKNANLGRNEKLIAIAFIADDPWTPDNGCLTAANKLQRRMVVERHNDLFQKTRKSGIF